MRNFWYSNLKEEDYTEDKIRELKSLGVTDVVIDFDITTNILPKKLWVSGIKPWFRVKLYERPDRAELERWLTKCKVLGCFPAIDAEAYSNSPIWEDLYNVVELSTMIKDLLISFKFSEIVLYPEIFGYDFRYRFYPVFIYEMNKYCKTMYVLHELTYHRLWWFELRNAFRENDKLLQMYLELGVNNPIKSVLGIWPGSFKWKWLGRLQHFFAKKLGFDLFLYTETKELFGGEK